MKTIKPKRGKYVILIDDEDYQKVIDFAINGWEVRFFTKSNNPYAITRKTITENGKRVRKQYYLHRLIMNVLNSTTPHLDHINKNTLDNRKENLRFVTRSQNMRNRSSKKTSRCKHLGVSYCLSKVGDKKYRVNIQDGDIIRKNIHLGYFLDEESAGYAYNQAAIILHGQYANLNNINEFAIINPDEIKTNVIKKINNFIKLHQINK